MNQIELLTAKVEALSLRVARLETLLQNVKRGASQVTDADLAERLIREFGGDPKAVVAGDKSANSCRARLYAVEALVLRAKWSQRRTATAMGISQVAVQKSLRKLSGSWPTSPQEAGQN